MRQVSKFSEAPLILLYIKISKFLAFNAKNKSEQIQCGVNGPLIKVHWIAAVVLLIPSIVGLVNDQICRRRISKFRQPMGSKGLLPWPIRSKKMFD